MPERPAAIAAASIASWKRSDSSALVARRPEPDVTCAGMSRQRMTVTSGTELEPSGEPVERRSELAVAGAHALEREAEPSGCRAGALRQRVVVGLRR